jgi:hypothetical protein
MDPAVMEALRRWSEDELRSMNGQIEFLLRQALLQSGRMKAGASQPPSNARASDSENDTDGSTT